MRKETSVFVLISEGHLNKLKTFIKQEPSCLYERNVDGFTPLMQALYIKKCSLAREILHYEETEINVYDKDGWTPLFLACRYEHQNLSQRNRFNQSFLQW